MTLFSIFINGIGVCFLAERKTVDLDLKILRESLFTLNHIESFASSASIMSVLYYYSLLSCRLENDEMKEIRRFLYIIFIN